MPKIQLIHEGLPDLLPMTNRSEGVHVSHVIHRLCVAMGHYEERTGDLPMTKMGLGNAMEHAIIHRFHLAEPDRYVQPGEREKDGIYCTPDLFDIIDWVVHEIKLTWMSSRNGPRSEKFWKYLVQLMSYCTVMGTRQGILHVGFVNGDYKYGEPSGQPTYRVWAFEFTKAELARNWRMILRESHE